MTLIIIGMLVVTLIAAVIHLIGACALIYGYQEWIRREGLKPPNDEELLRLFFKAL